MSRRQTGFPTEVRQVIVARSGGRCEICGEYDEWAALHHRRPRGMGSTRRKDTNAVSAGLLLCAKDHVNVESHRRWALSYGFLVRQSESPADVPVLYRGRMCLLGDDGSIAPYEQKAS